MDENAGSTPATPTKEFMSKDTKKTGGDALYQCVCGHQRHEGKCGKPRYSVNDACQCSEFIEAA